MHDFVDDGDGLTCAHTYENGAACGLHPRNGRHVQQKATPTASVSARTIALANGAAHTSAEAALRALENSAGVKARVFAVVACAGRRGMTDDELAQHPDLAGVNANTLRPRRIDLTTDGVLVHATTPAGGEVLRETRGGSLANAWTLSPAARAYLIAPMGAAA